VRLDFTPPSPPLLLLLLPPQAAEKKDFSKVRVVLELLKKPYASTAEASGLLQECQETVEKYRAPAPDWAAGLICSCSS